MTTTIERPTGAIGALEKPKGSNTGYIPAKIPRKARPDLPGELVKLAEPARRNCKGCGSSFLAEYGGANRCEGCIDARNARRHSAMMRDDPDYASGIRGAAKRLVPFRWRGTECDVTPASAPALKCDWSAPGTIGLPGIAPERALAAIYAAAEREILLGHVADMLVASHKEIRAAVEDGQMSRLSQWRGCQVLVITDMLCGRCGGMGDDVTAMLLTKRHKSLKRTVWTSPMPSERMPAGRLLDTLVEVTG